MLKCILQIFTFAVFHKYLDRCSFYCSKAKILYVAIYYVDDASVFVSQKHLPATPGLGYDYNLVNTDVKLNSNHQGDINPVQINKHTKAQLS